VPFGPPRNGGRCPPKSHHGRNPYKLFTWMHLRRSQLRGSARHGAVRRPCRRNPRLVNIARIGCFEIPTDCLKLLAMTPVDRPRTARRAPMDVPSTAAYLGISERHVRRLVAERRIDFIKIGSRVRFCPDDLDGFLAACRLRAQAVVTLDR